MALDLERALSELAHTPPVGDDSFPADGMTTTVRRMATHVRRRRAAKHAGTSIVGVAAVAAIAIGGSAIKSHVDAAGGPSTALSKRAGAVCGQPFDATGKSDPRFISHASPGPVGSIKNVPYMWLTNDVVNVARPQVKLSSTTPMTVVILQDGVVAGITEALTTWKLTHPGASADPGDDPGNALFVPVREAMNCTSTLSPELKVGMFDVVILHDFAVEGADDTALVVSGPVKEPTVLEGPGTHTLDELQPGFYANTWFLFTIARSAGGLGDQVGFTIGDYLAVRNTHGANIPLYWATPGFIAPDPEPYGAPAEAHSSGSGSVILTVNGTKTEEWSEAALGY